MSAMAALMPTSREVRAVDKGVTKTVISATDGATDLIRARQYGHSVARIRSPWDSGRLARVLCKWQRKARRRWRSATRFPRQLKEVRVYPCVFLDVRAIESRLRTASRFSNSNRRRDSHLVPQHGAAVGTATRQRAPKACQKEHHRLSVKGRTADAGHREGLNGPSPFILVDEASLGLAPPIVEEIFLDDSGQLENLRGSAAQPRSPV